MKRSTVASALAVIFVLVNGPAHAGTKYLSNITPLSDSSPTLSSKSKILVKEQGIIKAKLKDVVAGGGAGSEVTTDQSFKDNGTLTGDEYVVVLGGSIPSIGIAFKLNLIVEPKRGNGSVKSNIQPIVDLIPDGLVRSIVINSTEVYGPIGGAMEACQSNLDDSDGISFPPATNPCEGGDFIGEAGVEVP